MPLLANCQRPKGWNSQIPIFAAVKNFGAYIGYFLFWMIFFFVARGLFLVYHLNLANELTLVDVLNIFRYGLRMDASFSAYICIFPFILYLVKAIRPRVRVSPIVRVYSVILIVILSFVTIADLELYSAWGFRMDATPLQYFKSPKEMAGTVSSAPLFILSIIFLFLCFIFIFLLRYFNLRAFRRANAPRVVNIFAAAFLIAVLFIPIRGGIQKIPLNTSDAYFTDKIFADHAAINLPWNVMFSILNRNSHRNPFQYFDDAKAERLVHEMFATGTPHIHQVVDTPRPNIIFIILESYTAKFVGALGGVPGVTPQLDAIAADGILFKNIYAAGDRSEKGQVAILSGYPNQAINSIIKIPTKTRSLPSLAKTLESYNYYCNYTYGGELEFANIKSYLINTGYKHLVSKYSFPMDWRTTSWGVHDQYVFDRFHNDLAEEPTPFFSTIFSLSSHEPYDVPLKHFGGADETSLFKNSIYYTDSVLGDFIRKIKKEPYWKNTLVVIVADHGHHLPGNDPNDVPSKFHIPLIFTGGALNWKGLVEKTGSQNDIAGTVLAQLKIPFDDFHWSKNLLDSSANSFAFYNFNNGFGWVTDSGYATVDNVSKQIIHRSQGFDTSHLKYGKAFMQVSYGEYLKK